MVILLPSTMKGQEGEPLFENRRGPFPYPRALSLITFYFAYTGRMLYILHLGLFVLRLPLTVPGKKQPFVI